MTAPQRMTWNLPGQGLRVLLAEPDDDLAALLQRTLTERGIELERLTLVDDVLRRAREGGHDVWLFEERLGGDKGGVALMRTLYDDGRTTPAVIMGAHPDGAMKALMSGASDYVPKGAAMEQALAPILRQAAMRQRVRREITETYEALQERVQQLETRSAEQEAQLAARDAELLDANRRAADAQAQRNVFLANVSHELRTPMTTIIGFTGVLIERASGPLTPEQSKQLELIQTAATQLLALINDVLDLARLESGQTQLFSLPLDLGALVAELRESTQKQLRGRAVDVSASGTFPVIESDPTKVRQILWNLCLTASRMTQQGRIELVVEPRGDTVAVHVTDTGEGMTPEDVERVFEKFHQLSPNKRRSRASTSGGTGLGLPLAAELARALGGELRAKSSLGQGSTFTLTLPNRPAKRP